MNQMFYFSEAPTPPQYEPNWYLSTVVQSTAALIAIMGGFLINRLLSLNSEKKSIERRLAEVQTKHHIAEDQIRRDTRTIVRKTLSWFEQDALQEIVNDPNQNLEDLVSIHRYRGDDKAKTLEFAQELAEDVMKMRKEIERVSPAPKIPPTSEAKLRSAGVRMRVNQEVRIALMVSKRMHDERRLLAGKPVVKKGISIAPIIPPSEFQMHDERISQRDTRKVENRFLEGEIGGLSAHLTQIPSPFGMFQGFLILLYFAVIGIAVPLYKMTKNPIIAHIETRALIYWGFLAGLIWLLLYVGISIFSLLKVPDWVKRIRKS